MVRSLSGVEGIPTDPRSPLATFTSGPVLVMCADPRTFSASVGWGDGTSSPAVIEAGSATPPLQPCNYTVSASHIYANALPSSYSVTVSTSNTSQTGTGAVAVVDQLLTGGSPATLTAVAGTPFSGPIGSFTDPVPQPAAAYSASVNWGDGSSSAGTVAADPADPNRFVLAGSHTYAAAGNRAIVATITDQAGGAQTAVNAHALVASASGGGGGTGSGSAPFGGGIITSTTPTLTPAAAALPRNVFSLAVTSIVGRRGTLVVRIGCPAARRLCRGRLLVYRLANGQIARTIGSRVFLIAGGQTAALGLRLTARRLRALERVRKLRVRVIATAADPGTLGIGSGRLDSALHFRRG